MAAPSALEPVRVTWDLTALFDSMTDPRIEQTWVDVTARAEAFAARYRGQIDSPNLTAQTLRDSLVEIEQIYNAVAKPLSYAGLILAADSGNPAHGAFTARQHERSTGLSVTLMFYDLELQHADPALINRLLDDPILAPYAHYVRTTLVYRPFRLSEPEEIILEETANTGSRAWVRLFEELLANHTFTVRIPGEEPYDATEQEVLNLLREGDRAKRVAAGDSLTAGLKQLERVLVFNYNNLIQDKAVDDRLRKFANPEDSRHLSNELDKSTVDLVMDLCRDHYGLVARYYRIKRDILGLDELTHVDRYAPTSESEEEVGWERAREIVLESFGAFSPVMRARAAEFFDKNWIDAEPRKGKRGGAFCMYATPDTHPYVFQSYLNKMGDVMTLAHELGHGVHGSLSRAQTYLNFHGSLPLAELASIFGEMLVFERLVKDAAPKDQIALYAEKLEGIFASVFRQAAMFQFEQKCHAHRRTQGELTAEEFGEYWQTGLQAMFGDSVTLGDQHRSWWSYVGHFIFAPFYVYAYSFGELLVLSLYEMAKREGPGFADKYIEVLTLGGSKSPADLMAILGVDLTSREFWEGGFRSMESFLVEFERLYAAHGHE